MLLAVSTGCILSFLLLCVKLNIDFFIKSEIEIVRVWFFT